MPFFNPQSIEQFLRLLFHVSSAHSVIPYEDKSLKIDSIFSAILFSLWFTSQICFIKYSGIFPFILKTSNLSICLNFDSINSILKKGPKCANQSNRLDEWVTQFSVNLFYRIRIIERNYWNDSELWKTIILHKMRSRTAGFKKIRKKKSKKIRKIKILEKLFLKIFINPKIRFWNLLKKKIFSRSFSNFNILVKFFSDFSGIKSEIIQLSWTMIIQKRSLVSSGKIITSDRLKWSASCR